MIIAVDDSNYQELNQKIRDCDETEIVLNNVMGQRYIGCGLEDKHIKIYGTPGNALGAYMNGGSVEVYGNAQDAIGDTMNSGNIIIHGNCGDTTGYGMRGGEIFVKGNAGYRLGIHMKEYKDIKPVIVVGGKAGDFLGEYQAGGIIIVLGLGHDESPVGNLCGTGMHGGSIFFRGERVPDSMPEQVDVFQATDEEKELIKTYVVKYCALFGEEQSNIMNSIFTKLATNTKNPYKKMYVQN